MCTVVNQPNLPSYFSTDPKSPSSRSATCRYRAPRWSDTRQVARRRLAKLSGTTRDVLPVAQPGPPARRLRDFDFLSRAESADSTGPAEREAPPDSRHVGLIGGLDVGAAVIYYRAIAQAARIVAPCTGSRSSTPMRGQRWRASLQDGSTSSPTTSQTSSQTWRRRTCTSRSVMFVVSGQRCTRTTSGSRSSGIRRRRGMLTAIRDWHRSSGRGSQAPGRVGDDDCGPRQRSSKTVTGDRRRP